MKKNFKILIIVFITLLTAVIVFFIPTSIIPPRSDHASHQLNQSPFNKNPISAPSKSANEAKEEDLLKNNLQGVLNQYQKNMEYPMYSVPITRADIQGYSANVFTPLSIPLANGATVGIELPKFHFKVNEPIPITVTFSSPASIAGNVSVELNKINDTNPLQQSRLAPGKAGVYSGSITAAKDGEYKLLIMAMVDGTPIKLATTLVVDPNLGQVTHVGQTSVLGNNLIIPVAVKGVTLPGDYMLTANLYADGEPIAHLSANRTMSVDQQLDLQVYGSLLAGKNPKNLTVGDFLLEKLPNRPGDVTQSTYTDTPPMNVTIPDLTGLKNQPYQDTSTVERTKHLQNMLN